MAMRFVIRGDGIQLDQLLKASGLCDSGGAAKGEIAAGLVTVDGKIELRKRAQLKAGQVIVYMGNTIELADPAPGDVVPTREPRRVKPGSQKPGSAPKAGAGAGAPKPGGPQKPPQKGDPRHGGANHKAKNRGDVRKNNPRKGDALVPRAPKAPRPQAPARPASEAPRKGPPGREWVPKGPKQG